MLTFPFTGVNYVYICKRKVVKDMSSKAKLANSITEAELEVMKVLWANSPLSAAQIIEAIKSTRRANSATLKVLINRLLNKKVISHKESGRKYIYSPKIDEAEFYKFKTESFLSTFYGGKITPLVSFFSEQEKLTPNDLAELKELIKRLPKK